MSEQPTQPAQAPALAAAAAEDASTAPIPSSSSQLEPVDDLPACARLPPELLEQILAGLFHHHDSFRKRIRRMTTLAQVCKAWKPVAQAAALSIVSINVRDSKALEYLDPDQSPIRDALDNIRFLTIMTRSRITCPCSDSPSDAEDEEEELDDNSHEWVDTDNESEQGASSGDEQAGSDSASPDGSPRNIDITTCDVVSKLLQRTAKNLRGLVLDCGLERAIAQWAFTPDPLRDWSNLRVIQLIWEWHVPPLVAVLSRLSTGLSALEMLTLSINSPFCSTGAEEPSPLDLEPEMMEQFPVSGLKKLRSFEQDCSAPCPNALAALLPLLWPDAPLQFVRWAGTIPPGLFGQLRNSQENDKVIKIKCLVENEFQDELLPQLHDLAEIEVKELQLDLTSCRYASAGHEEETVALGTFLHAVPSSIRYIDVALRNLETNRSYAFRADETYAKILAQPRVSLFTRFKNGNVKPVWDSKPLVQVCFLSVQNEGEVDPTPEILARYKKSKAGDLTDWMAVRPAIVDTRGRYVGPATIDMLSMI
ncbi:hypothetical protein JCM10908_003640 [Rhodotorula pacifica]|uniref:uncharacterized protein n=1 Tax=Rhodotorula pacifica TaxID=1495444 RepID=UPI00317F60C8